MAGKKINIFLGGFINYTNAQNLNCLALAKHLDKEKFKVFSLELYSGNLESQIGRIEGLTVFKCFYPAKFSMYLGFLWGIWHCDVAYLPKGELWKWNKFWLKVLRKKSFSTIEGVLDEAAMKNAIQPLGSKSNYLASRKYYDKDYSITSYMKKYNFDAIGMPTEEKVLYLGVDSAMFKSHTIKEEIPKVLMIGNDLVRKGVFDYFELAKKFPEITFYLAGSGNGKIDVNLEISKRNLNNVIYKGSVTTQQLLTLLQDVSIHILPSRSEGFPKVMLETAAAGVPTILYSDYGASEWINHSVNGWVVNTKEEMIAILSTLIANPQQLQNVASEAIQLASSFDWKLRVKAWEEVIIELENNNNN
jgi:glycosyltransferase involved in cell wall biosynthesis